MNSHFLFETVRPLRELQCSLEDIARLFATSMKDRNGRMVISDLESLSSLLVNTCIELQDLAHELHDIQTSLENVENL